MKGSANRVTSYIDEQAVEWRPTLKKLRAACRRELSGYTEATAY